MHKKKCKMHKMHEDMTFNARKVLQRSKELNRGPKEQKLNHRNPSHPNTKIVWNDCLMRSETRVGRMRTGYAHRQGVKSIKHFL